MNSITRIVTSFGHWNYIKRWLFNENLIQSHVKWIFINDKPEDKAPIEIKNRIEEFGQLIENKVNMGRCLSRNRGIHLAATEWIDIIDGDDLPFPIPDDFYHGHEDSDLIYFCVKHHSEIEGKICYENNDDWTPSRQNQMVFDLIGNYHALPVGTLFRRTSMIEVGGYDGRSDYIEDMNLGIRMRLAGFKTSNSNLVKASYQRDTPNRLSPAIIPVAFLETYELGRKVVSKEFKDELEEHIQFYRMTLLWKGMEEVNKSKPTLCLKLKECVKWIIK